MLFAIYHKISKIVAESPEELENIIVRSSGFHLVDAPHGCGWQHNGCEWTWGTVEHCACAFICVAHGHRPRILPYTLSALSDPRSVGHNPSEDLKMYLTTHAKTVFVKLITVFFRGSDNGSRTLWSHTTIFLSHEGTVGSVLRANHVTFWPCNKQTNKQQQQKQGTGVFISVLSNRCCPTCMLLQILPTPSLLTSVYNTWKSWTQKFSTC